jgi:hypothetical protein
MISFSTGKEKNCSGSVKSLLFFATAQTEKHLWKKIVKTGY